MYEYKLDRGTLFKYRVLYRLKSSRWCNPHVWKTLDFTDSYKEAMAIIENDKKTDWNQIY